MLEMEPRRPVFSIGEAVMEYLYPEGLVSGGRERRAQRNNIDREVKEIMLLVEGHSKEQLELSFQELLAASVHLSGQTKVGLNNAREVVRHSFAYQQKTGGEAPHLYSR